MKYYAVILTLQDEEKNRSFRPQHLAFLEQMRQENKVVMNGPFTDGAGGLVIYAANDLEEAISYLKQDPYIVNGARNWEIHEWALDTNPNFQL
ncbi:hypothetical protein FH966_10500 [Lentibacillus cibarius]|uniref:YCII-related domain-containing protein n=1 Tax=Lentibacillus cibarius TaxID=2583219 RepID=A0A549YJK8_9BACI|nr:YciI family protein [Lentibacillus cibarius]TMN23291.1 hypothetical protein FFL34_15235 [Lentibacillus cibarius]TRM12077.1 hypothetical protein FH966_10500 [Lentibacillus cibarius]